MLPLRTARTLASASAFFFLGCSASGAPSPSDGDAGGADAVGSGSTSGTGGGLTVGAGGLGVGGMPNACKVVEQDGPVPPCSEKAPPNAFAPEVQWTWTVPASSEASYPGSVVTPLVGNLTDDNGDGAIDLCDIPDVIVATMDTYPSGGEPGTLWMLAGDTGTLELEFPTKIDPFITPALGDLDGDGVAEIVAALPDHHVVAFGHDGSVKWTSSTLHAGSWCGAVSLYDLDGDGSVEVIMGRVVFDAKGQFLWQLNDSGGVLCETSTAADLDGDGKLEVISGNTAYHADGTLYWKLDDEGGHPMVANLDADPEPEVLFTGTNGIRVVEHDGTTKFGPVRPTDPVPSVACWAKPGAIHDFDGDGKPDAAIGTCTDYSIYEIGATATPRWSAPVTDMSGLATGTAFDFLGDGVADAIYADEHLAYVFEGASGDLELSQPRQSGTFIEYPVVADVDNDGSAEIVIVSSWGWFGPDKSGPTVTVIRDAQDRWIRARRIWNQHAYHVTNVLEDGRIPKTMKKSWQALNTFRTNAQIDTSGDCDPPK